MPTYHKRKRRKWHVLKKTIVVLLGILEKHVVHRHEQETIQKFIQFLQNLYE